MEPAGESIPVSTKYCSSEDPAGQRSMSDRASPTLPDIDEVIHVNDRVVACDGGGGPLGHPRVFLRIVAADVVCPYCSRIYVLNEGAGHDTGH